MTAIMSDAASPIVIESDGRRWEFADRDVYFPFGSARLGYDCVTCGAKCCRGHGYELRAGDELRAQITQSAPARFFVDPCEASEHHFHVRNLAPGCFFLRGDGLCGIQAQQGYALKPQTCRLFPFNQLGVVGSHLIVAPHPDLCPLDVMPHGSESQLSDYGELLAAMSGATINVHAIVLPIGDADAARLVESERWIVELSERHANGTDYRVFATEQLEAANHAAPHRPEHAPSGMAAAQIETYIEHLRHVLGTPRALAATGDASVCRILTAATPALRAHTLLWQAASRPLGTRPADRLPRMLLALYCFAVSAHEAGMTRLTYQSVMTLSLDYQALLQMLAWLDEPVMWRPDVTIDLTFGGDDVAKHAYARIVQALLPKAQLRNRAPLGRILSEQLTVDGLPRILFLKRLASRLSGRIVAVDAAPHSGLRRRVQRPRAAVQQWAVRHLTEDMVTSLGERMSRAGEGGACVSVPTGSGAAAGAVRH
jgi:hypothetical protein